MTRAIGAVVLLAVLSGCQSRAQVVAQTALNATAEGLVLADRVVLTAMQPRIEEAVAETHERCAFGCDNPVLVLREILASWYQAVRGLEITRESLALLQAAAEVWYATGSIPESWRPLCRSVVDALVALVALLETVGVEVPETVRVGPRLLGALCEAGGAR